MKKKLHLLTLISALLSVGGLVIAGNMAIQKTEIQMKDGGKTDGTVIKSVGGDLVATPFRVYMTQNTEIETLFLTSLNNVYVTITNSTDAIVYSNRASASGNSRLFVNIQNYAPGTYTISVSSLDDGIMKYGTFDVK